MGEETINPMSMDPLAWHLALTLVATLAGYKFYDWYKQHLPNIELPVMCLAMIAGVILQTILNHTPFRDSVDEHVEGRIGSMVTDYLVGFGVASISITVVMEFAAPIVLLCILGMLTSLTLVFVVGRKLFHNFWFERSIFVFGWTTGVVAIGVTLLRIVDPEAKSGTLNDYGYSYTIQSVVEVFIIAMVPIMAVSLGCIQSGAILTVIAIALFLFGAKVFGVHNSSADRGIVCSLRSYNTINNAGAKLFGVLRLVLGNGVGEHIGGSASDTRKNTQTNSDCSRTDHIYKLRSKFFDGKAKTFDFKVGNGGDIFFDTAPACFCSQENFGNSKDTNQYSQNIKSAFQSRVSKSIALHRIDRSHTNRSKDQAEHASH